MTPPVAPIPAPPPMDEASLSELMTLSLLWRKYQMTIRALLTSDALAALQQNPGLRPAAAIELVKHNNADYVRYLNSLDRDGYRALWHSIETASKSARV